MLGKKIRETAEAAIAAPAEEITRAIYILVFAVLVLTITMAVHGAH